MSTASILMVIRLVAEGIGVAKEIKELARRVEAGEEITQAEIDQARVEVDAAVDNWNNAVKEDDDGSDNG